jgi:hypothetical protein
VIENIEFPYRRWDGPVGEWSEHFGKGRGQVHSLDGAAPLRSCTEVEVAKRLRGVRRQAYWFSGYNVARVPEIWRPWVRSLNADVPGWLSQLDRTIRGVISTRRGGMPDVVAWDDSDPMKSALFVECKGPREAVLEAQEDWVWAATQAGLTLSQVAVSVRPF